MSGAWLASYIALWAVVLFQGLVIFLLLRQLGIMYLGTAQGVARDGLAVGQRAPDFALPALDGRTVALADFLSRPLLLIFGSPNCAPCRSLIPDLNAFAREKREEIGVLFLMRGEAEAAQRFVDETGIEAPVAVHPDERLPDQYKARVTPFAFVIDREGIIRAKGLANNRDHLTMLLHMAEDNTKSSRNGARVGERHAAEEAQR